MDLTKLKTIFRDQKPFRVKQIKQAVFRDLISGWQEAQWLPQGLKERLNQESSLTIKAQDFYSQKSDSVKSLITLNDDLKVETVLINHNNGRHTVCVSSQIGCPLGCIFCATGKIGFQRNLSDWEIVEQVIHFNRLLKEKNKDKEKVTNIVFMGMGEPFLNYNNVISAIRILNNPDGLNIGVRHISISTVGIINGIKKLADEPLQINLAISLHAPNNELRSKLIPINNHYSLEKIIGSVSDYIQRTNRKVMLEYLMIEDVNDSDKYAVELVNLIKNFKKPLIMVNLIKYNETLVFKSSSTERIKKFKDILIKEGVFVTERYRFGEDIQGACGQLAGQSI